jgi:hypothetical protein
MNQVENHWLYEEFFFSKVKYKVLTNMKKYIFHFLISQKAKKKHFKTKKMNWLFKNVVFGVTHSHLNKNQNYEDLIHRYCGLKRCGKTKLKQVLLSIGLNQISKKHKSKKHKSQMQDEWGLWPMKYIIRFRHLPDLKYDSKCRRFPHSHRYETHKQRTRDRIYNRDIKNT